jgi:DNA-binding MarR family transcriptional regulator
VIARRRPAADRRVIDITLTAAGQALYSRYTARQATRLTAAPRN